MKNYVERFSKSHKAVSASQAAWRSCSRRRARTAFAMFLVVKPGFTSYRLQCARNVRIPFIALGLIISISTYFLCEVPAQKALRSWLGGPKVHAIDWATRPSRSGPSKVNSAFPVGSSSSASGFAANLCTPLLLGAIKLALFQIIY